MKAFLILFFCFGLSHLAHAQILNIEDIRSKQQGDSTRRLAGRASLSFSTYNRTAAQDAPVKFLGFNSDLGLAYFSPKHLYMALWQNNYLKINENPFNNFAFIHLRTNFQQRNRFSPELFAQYQFDLLRGLDSRLLGGAGVRYTVVRVPQKIALYYGLGIMYEEEKWHIKTKDALYEPLIDLWKASQYVNLSTQINDALALDMTAYHQFGYDADVALMRHRISVQSQLLYKIIHRLNFVVNASLTHDSAPVVPINKLTYKIANGVRFTF